MRIGLQWLQQAVVLAGRSSPGSLGLSCHHGHAIPNCWLSHDRLGVRCVGQSAEKVPQAITGSQVTDHNFSISLDAPGIGIPLELMVITLGLE
jgi:hypothetical protein